MKVPQLTISKQANQDLTEIWLYIANDSPQTADSFLDTILEQCQSLCFSPELGRNRDELFPGVRSFPLKRYIIYYRTTENSVEIIRVLSGYRDLHSIF